MSSRGMQRLVHSGSLALLGLFGSTSIAAIGTLTYFSKKHPKEFQAWTEANRAMYGSPEIKADFDAQMPGLGAMDWSSKWSWDGEGIFESIPDWFKDILTPNNMEERFRKAQASRQEQKYDYVQYVRNNILPKE